MASHAKLGMLFLHALPLDGSMWAEQMHLLPGSTYAPTLYSWGDRIEEWAMAALKLVREDRLIVVGCSVGGSCALEVAAIAPDRVAAMVLIGTKAQHRPDSVLHASALTTIREKGLEESWNIFWGPLISDAARSQVISVAKRIALRQSPDEVSRGVTVFHTRPSRDQLLCKFPNPVIFVTGADDSAPDPTTQAALAQHGHLHVIPECGHYVPMERPANLNSILSGVIAALQ